MNLPRLSTEEILDEWETLSQKAKKGRCHVLWRSYSEKQYIGCLKYLNFTDEKLIDSIEQINPDRVGMYNSVFYYIRPSGPFF